MHTDEYEISIGREIKLCRDVIRRLRKAIEARELQKGMSTDDLCGALGRGELEASNPEVSAWLKDHRELQAWESKLLEYGEALETLKEI